MKEFIKRNKKKVFEKVKKRNIEDIKSIIDISLSIVIGVVGIALLTYLRVLIRQGVPV